MTLGMKLRNHSQSRNPATPGRTLVRERCFVGEAKFDSAKREGKCVRLRQTLVPVTETTKPGGMVRARGLEPPILSEPDPKSGASAIPPRAHPPQKMPAADANLKPERGH